MRSLEKKRNIEKKWGVTLKRWTIFVLVITFLSVNVLPARAFADLSTEDFNAELDSMIQVIKANYYKDVTVEDLKTGALKGMFSVLDKHSSYYTPEEFTELNIGLSGNVVGIGVSVEKNPTGGIKVVGAYEGSSAFDAGIKSGDVILSVDGIDITDYTLEKAVSIIRGDEGTKVKIGLRRGGTEKMIYFTLVRKPVIVNPVSYKILDGNIGYIKITQFNGNVVDGVNAAFEKLDTKGVEGIIFDLRGNPGGYLDEVIAICQALIPAGPVVHIQQKGVITETYSSTLEKAPYKLVALVDEGSASASEIMAGAIKDSGAGILVGEKTYGKGTVQSVMNLLSGSGLKITIANYLTPSQFSLDGIGLTPNITVNYDLEKILGEYYPLSKNANVKPGNISLDVLSMQQRLNYLGYGLKEDGVFGGNTLQAVKRFQRLSKLTVDGTMSRKDLDTLEYKFEEQLVKKDPQMERAIKEMKKMLK